jgi:hypothetical protein
MSGGRGGPRALNAFGKACNRNKRIGDTALMVYSLGTGQGRDDAGDANLSACFIWLYLCRVIVAGPGLQARLASSFKVDVIVLLCLARRETPWPVFDTVVMRRRKPRTNWGRVT